ncbi:hypothetical protein [Natrarchaeobius chitinivorans]|nr:hypothetical protein [Natrarchaeobius chitinivorans]
MSKSLPGTAERVPESTHEAVNERIVREIGDRVQYYAERRALEAIRNSQ